MPALPPSEADVCETAPPGNAVMGLPVEAAGWLEVEPDDCGVVSPPRSKSDCGDCC